MSILKAQQLAKHYKSKQVVKDFSLHVSTGEVVGLLGPNGAGKTTSFYMIVGLIAADKGHVYLDDTELTTLPIHQRARLGISYLPQEASVFRKLTVAENILAILELRDDLKKPQRLQTLQSLLEEFHLTHLQDVLGMSLSGGERRRVEIARAIARDPQFILMDEPFAGVDPISVVDIKRIILHLRDRGVGILITDHNVRETLDTCQRAYIVNDGQLLCEGTPQEILANKEVRQVYLGKELYLELKNTHDKRRETH